MHLVMFDLDGTLVDSNAIDSNCYLQALVDVFGFDLDRINRDWSNYPHITDAGILRTLCQTELGREPTIIERQHYQQRFLALLTIAVGDQPLQEILGARDILQHLSADPNYAIALATGSWGRTAQFKLHQTNLTGLISPTASADDSYTRVEIMQCAHQRATACYGRSQFTKITYIGDGVWDGIASGQLDYQFIGIGTDNELRQQASALLAHGATAVFPNYQNLAAIMSMLT
jgi:phosphoglycolate phosphatase-like HAD superfamily hydrolase